MHGTVLQFLKDCQSTWVPALAAKFRSAAFMPVNVWLNAATSPSRTSAMYLFCPRTTWTSLSHWKEWILARSSAGARRLLREGLVLWQLLRLVQAVLCVDGRKQNFSGWLALGKDRITEILVDVWAPLTKPARDVRLEDIFSDEDRDHLEAQAARRTEQLGQLPQQPSRPSKLPRRGLLRRRARDCGTRTNDASSADAIFSILVCKDLLGSLDSCEYCAVQLSFEGRSHSNGLGLARLINPHVLSIDARIPRCKGGSYDDDNIAASTFQPDRKSVV